MTRPTPESVDAARELWGQLKKRALVTELQMYPSGRPEIVEALAAFRDEAVRAELEKIRAILFPKPREVESKGQSLMVSAHALWNLEGALTDMEHNKADAVCCNTIRRVCEQLSEAVDLLGTAQKRYLG